MARFARRIPLLRVLRASVVNPICDSLAIGAPVVGIRGPRTDMLIRTPELRAVPAGRRNSPAREYPSRVPGLLTSAGLSLAQHKEISDDEPNSFHARDNSLARAACGPFRLRDRQPGYGNERRAGAFGRRRFDTRHKAPCLDADGERTRLAGC